MQAETKYSCSTDGETYHGQFDTELEAAYECANGCGEGYRFYIGVNRPPQQPEDMLGGGIERLLDCMGEGHDDWSFDFAEWDMPTREQIAELAQEFRPIMAAWLDRHGLRPRWFCVDEIAEYVVVDGKPMKEGVDHASGN